MRTAAILRSFADAVSAQNAAAALGMVDELYRQSRDLGRLCEELLTYYRNLMVVKTVKQPQGLVLCMPEELEQLKQQAQRPRCRKSSTLCRNFSPAWIG